MAILTPWPIPTISQVELFYFLLDDIGVEKEQLITLEPLKIEMNTSGEEKSQQKIALQEKPENWDSEKLHNLFLHALAEPESRLKLSEASGLSYEQITQWVIRADLLRIELPLENKVDKPKSEPLQHSERQKITKFHAAFLAESGIIGVHDLAQRGASDFSIIEGVEIQDFTPPPDIPPDIFNTIVKEAQRLATITSPTIITSTQAIIVVKGAGSHRQDETLDVFLKGFWPSVAQIYPNATLTEHTNLSFPLNPENLSQETAKGRIAQIHAGERRVWIKESYWEPGIRPPGSFPALLIEWRMATYVFGSVIWELISSPSRKDRRLARQNNDFWRYLRSFLYAHLLVLFAITFTFWGVSIPLPLKIYKQLDSTSTTGIITNAKNIYDQIMNWWDALPEPYTAIIALGVTIVVAVLISISPASDTALIMQESEKNNQSTERLPGVSSWLLIILIGAFLVHPIRYLLFLAIFVSLQAALIAVRSQLWSNRGEDDSDTNLTDFNVLDSKPEAYSKGNSIQRFILSPLLYRYIIVIALPIIVILLVLARILRAIPVLTGVGVWIENLANATLSGGLGDVVTYANEPGEAAWIRSTIMTDLITFHERVDVKHIHVFAHSQGTPITFETLFYHLPGTLRRKLKTYVTIGSVLNYFHQANRIFDLSYIQRFPRRPYPYQDFADGFQWVNFWNHNDPIPEFSALESYRDYYLNSDKLELNKASPINIKTRGAFFPWDSHGEYWTNLTQVQIPFAYRVLFGYPIEKDQIPQSDNQVNNAIHASSILWYWMPSAIIILILGIGLMITISPDFGSLEPLWTWIVEQFRNFFAFMNRGEEIKVTKFKFVSIVTYSILGVAIFNWVLQLIITLQRFQNRGKKRISNVSRPSKSHD